jgi:PAS domain S-box-containing protein
MGLALHRDSVLAENIFDTVREPLVLLDRDLKVVKVSQSFFRFFKVSPEETIGKLIYNLGNSQWDIPVLRDLLERILPDKSSFDDFEVTHYFAGIGNRTMLLNARQIEQAMGKEKIILLAIEDITERKQKEETLDEAVHLSAKYLDILFNQSHVPILIWDTSHTITHSNAAFKEMMGYDFTEVGDKKLDILFSKERLDSSLEMINRTLNSEMPELLELEIRTKDNSVKTVLWNSANILDKDGIRVVATLTQDITSRKRLEESLAILETRYRRLFESAKDGILILNAETGTIIDVNPYLIDLLGYSKENLIEKEIWEIGFFHDITSNKEKFLELQKQEYVRYDDLPLESADGRTISVEFVSNVYIVNNEKVIQCNIRDISDRKRVDKALVESENSLRALVQTIPDLIWLKDPAGKYLSCNPMFERFFGATEEEMRGKTDYDFVDRETADSFREHDKKAMIAGKPTKNEELITFADDGHQVYLETIKAPMFDSQNKLKGVLGIGRDISGRKVAEYELIKAKEKAQESDRLKSAFLANMSHEIRTPMNGILGFTSLLKESNLSGEQQQEYIEIIEKSGARLLNIINDIINISKVESGNTEVFFADININEQIEDICSFFKPLAMEKHLRLSSKSELSEDDTMIRTDKEKFLAVLTNLVGNAIKFTEHGSIEIACKRRKNWLEVSVSDTGIGIPDSQKGLIFDRFRQGSESLSRNYEGAGLGLAISKAYTKLLGGRIRIEDNPERSCKTDGKLVKGSKFIFTIPYINGSISKEMSAVEVR